jgi:hypothetical protein
MSTTAPLDRIGVGIDTARYGHRVSFLKPNRLPAAKAPERDGEPRRLPGLKIRRRTSPSAPPTTPRAGPWPASALSNNPTRRQPRLRP